MTGSQQSTQRVPDFHPRKNCSMRSMSLVLCVVPPAYLDQRHAYLRFLFLILGIFMNFWFDPVYFFPGRSFNAVVLWLRVVISKLPDLSLSFLGRTFLVRNRIRIYF